MEALGQMPPGAANQDEPQGANDEAKRLQEEQMRRDLITTVLDTTARERLSRIALVSPTRSKQIESIILRMAQSGQLRGRITENQLIELLKQIEEAQEKSPTGKSTIVYQRRKDLDDDFDI